MKKTRDPELTLALQEARETEDRWRGLATRLLELGDDAMDAQLLVAFRAAREEGVVPPDAGFFLVAHILTAMADEALTEVPRVQRLALELDLMEREYGMEDGCWQDDEEPPPEDWEALLAEYENACDEARAAFFRAYGEEDMARLYVEDRVCFHRRFECGRRFFHGLPMLPEHLH
ncbi:hypothetical protein HUA74_28645 [Myxococcus sp. CA051A]|uniref:Uncharacterized protein n=1 Tax=Myxococcus llanfairpwllgwyngyllgogerychwyrndrobwllllantysiliogogogochensis TaxID=2590453 RepID=A0A540X7N7_9BACT|nr:MULTISPECIES: hypothetical protein [Myxococcus]NTX05538.1 hypothetical protein [Myxococcus sp. CA040A]NTX10160.1 hypothetical protein [Myxococcus sp. CA056]NTX41518.1 hypothetical protein [Myxococcus sp. CA033]NTX52129.1 hypothetical protein [Myxococcus sp. CA039A]NTX64624.1 hypothetical protein [Myxococcus sp. CA051A]